MIRVVLDTNVQVSALLSKGGTCDRVLRKWIDDEFILCTCKEILWELEKVIKFPHIANKHKLSNEKIDKYVKYQERNSLKVVLPEIITIVKAHPSDSIFVLCAMEAKADYIISGDNNLLKMKSYKSTKIITPKEFIERL